MAKDAVVTAQTELAALEKRRDGLRLKCDDAQASYDLAVARRSDLLAEGDYADSALASCDDAVASAQRALAAAQEVVAAHDRKVEGAKEYLASELDRKARAAEAERVAKILADASAAVEQLKKAATAFVSALAPVGADGAAVSRAMQQFTEQIAPVATSALKHGQVYREQILAGTRAVPPPPAALVKPPPVPEIPKRVMYALRGLKWQENGETKTAGEFSSVALPAVLVARAQEARCVAELTDEVVRDKLVPTYGFRWEVPRPDDGRLTDLDKLPEKPESAAA